MGMCCDRGFVEIHHVALISRIVGTSQKSKLVLHSNAEGRCRTGGEVPCVWPTHALLASAIRSDLTVP